MKISISTKSFNASDHLKEIIEKKFLKLEKFFAQDIETNITLSMEKGRQKIEATINADGSVFRAEEDTQDIYNGIDRVVEKLSSQMSKYKKKIANRHKDNKAILFEQIPDAAEVENGRFEIARRKTYTLNPMTPEEAILQMELLSHTFFVFLDIDRNNVSVVYKRNDGKYGLLETSN